MKARLIILSVLMSAALTGVATPYHTPRLEKMAKALALNLPEAPDAGIDTDNMATHYGKPLHIKTNSFGIVSHIGYKLFSLPENADAVSDPNVPVFEFIERYLLELDLKLDGRNKAERMDIDQVVLVKGTLNLLDAITPETPFSIEEITRKGFRITWTVGGQDVTLSFPASCQLLLGANAIELELMAEKDIQRITPIAGEELISDWASAKVSRSQDLLVIEGESYISELIRNDIFLKETGGERHLLCDRQNARKSVSNIMLTGIFSKELPLTLRMNRYGHKIDTFNSTIQQFITFCKMEGCKLYFGIKSMNEEELSGTLFATNEKLGYNHLLSIVFPLSILDGDSLPVKGTSYVYIPVNRVEEEFFYQFKKQTK